MKRLFYIGLVMGLAIVTLISTAGVALADGATKEIHVKQASLDDWQDGAEDIYLWHFVINHITRTSSEKPATITVQFINGKDSTVLPVEVDVSLSEPFTADVAHYTFTTAGYNDPENPLPDNPIVADAWTEINSAWDGQFVLSNIDDYEPIIPTPELPTVALLGIGLAGITGYIGFRKFRNSRLQVNQ